jgi:Erv1 / Alr family
MHTSRLLPICLASYQTHGKAYWGPILWTLIHGLALLCDTEPKATVFARVLATFPIIMGCKECADHLELNLGHLPIQEYMGDRRSLFVYTYALHDLVNKQINAELMSSASNGTPKIGKIHSSPDCESVWIWYNQQLGFL